MCLVRDKSCLLSEREREREERKRGKEEGRIWREGRNGVLEGD